MDNCSFSTAEELWAQRSYGCRGANGAAMPGEEGISWLVEYRALYIRKSNEQAAESREQQLTPLDCNKSQAADPSISKWMIMGWGWGVG
jgi:hypothetical protein